MMNSIGRRRFMQIAGFTALAASLDGPIARAAAERLRLIFWGGQVRADKTGQVSALFGEETSINVQNEFLSWNDYWTKLATQIAGGNAPDIFQMDYRYIVEYANRNAIAPLDEFVGDQLNLDDFDDDQVAGGTVDGKLYGISLGANSVACFVNTSPFEKAGIPAPNGPFTYDQLADFNEAFKKADVGMSVIDDASSFEQALENWLRQRKKALYTADGKLGFDENDAIEWFTMWAKLRDAGICVSAEDRALYTGSIDTSMIVTGKAALQLDNSNVLIAHQALMQDKLGLAPYPLVAPDATGGQYRKPSMFFSVAGTSKAKADAARYVSYFVNDLKAAKVLGTERGIPCAAHVRDALAPELSEQERLTLEYVAGLGDLIGPIPPAPPQTAGEIAGTMLTNISQQVAFGMQSPEAAGKDFVAQASDLLSRG